MNLLQFPNRNKALLSIDSLVAFGCFTTLAAQCLQKHTAVAMMARLPLKFSV